MFEQELWKNFCNYSEPFERFNCSHKILPSVLPKQMSESPIIKRRFSMKKTMSYNVEIIVIQSVKLCISFINKLIGQVLAKHREKKKVPKVSFTSVTVL